MWSKTRVSGVAMVLLLCSACSDDESSPQSSSEILEAPYGLTLNIIFPETLRADETEALRRQIEFYRFYFSGNFGELDPIDVEWKRYDPFIFSDIPYDERLRIVVQALSLNRHIVLCEGEQTVNYYAEKRDEIIIVLRCL